MIIEGKFLNLNLKKNIIDNYHYFDSLEILCNKFAINHLKSRFQYLLNDNVANLIKNLNKSKKQVKTNGTIDFINGSKNFLCESIYNHTPKVGDIIFFPNYLMHTVYPFNGSKEERRSISFNADIDQNIYDVYGPA